MSTRATYRSSAPDAAPMRRLVATVLVVVTAASCLSFAFVPAVVITRLTDLGFGDVAADASKQILYSDAGAASFRIDATDFVAQTGVKLAFSLPGTLSSGGDTLPVSFSTSAAAWSYTNSAAGATAFDPNVEQTISKQGANFSVYIWVGASINTTGVAGQNTYSNTLILDAAAQ